MNIVQELSLKSDEQKTQLYRRVQIKPPWLSLSRRKWEKKGRAFDGGWYVYEVFDDCFWRGFRSEPASRKLVRSGPGDLGQKSHSFDFVSIKWRNSDLVGRILGSKRPILGLPTRRDAIELAPEALGGPVLQLTSGASYYSLGRTASLIS